MNIAILDTETTNKTEGQPIEIAWIGLEYPSLQILGEIDLYFRPSKEIALGARATHHISESDLKDKPFVGSELYLQTITELKNYDYYIGHNIEFDLDVLKLDQTKGIDTLAFARKLIPDLDSYTQSALLYHFFDDEAKPWLKEAHNALCDVRNNYKLLLKLIEIGNLQDLPIEELYAFSEQCKIPDKLHFGKHFGKTYKEVMKTDPGYFTWWRTKSDTPPNKYQEAAIALAKI